MPRKIKLLFLGGAKRVSLAERFISAGAKLDLDIQIISSELDRYVPISSVAKIITGLNWKDPEIIEKLRKTLDNLEIDILLPFVDPATVIAGKLKVLCPEVFIPVSDASVSETFFDKRKADVWFRSMNFPVPDKMGFPLIAKPARGSASKGITVIHSADEFDFFRSRNNESEYLIQRFIFGEEYTIDSYVTADGKLLTAVPRKRLEVAGGEVVKAITVKDPLIMELAKTVIIKSAVRGPVNVQILKEKETGILYLMEMNPRFGGGVIASIEAGADITMMLLREFLKLPLEPSENWKDNLVMMRANREFFTYADNH